MIYNHTSILITNLLFYNIDNLLYKTTGINTIAHSPVMDCSPRSVAIHHEIVIVTQSKEIIIRISISNFTIDEFLKIQNYFSEIADNLHYILQIVFKKKFTIKDEKDINKNIYTVHNKEIDISVINHNGEKYIQFFIPIEFFRLFSKNISLNAPSDVIEDDVLNFFKNPKWMIPDSQFVLTSLSTVELGTLINQLLTRNQLTTYQLFLVLQAFPDLSGTIKNVLSKNIISDVIQFNKTAGKLKINRRDVTGGIYSIEESMYFILRDDDDIQYSHILRSIQLLIQASLNLELLLRKSFIEWISVIAADDLLHAAVSITEDAVMANALTRDRDRCIEIMNNFLTERKINDILILINDNTPL